MAESEEELKSLLMKVKEESEKVGLKLSTQKTKIMASGPITPWQIDGETGETVSDFILGGSKITADGDCNHEIKRHLLLGRKVITNLDSIFKSRNITLSTKVCLVKPIPFSRGSSDSGIEPGSLALQVNSLSSEPPRKTHEKQSKVIRLSPKFNDWCPCKEREI